jgi:hypothetical protein
VQKQRGGELAFGFARFAAIAQQQPQQIVRLRITRLLVERCDSHRSPHPRPPDAQ